MKKMVVFIITIIFMLGTVCCSSNKHSEIKHSFEPTLSTLVDEYIERSEEVTLIKYYELNDGTWKTDQYSYKYRLTLTGRMANTAKGITYIILSNREDITFDQAWKASGLSSNLNDYFKAEEAVIAATKMG